MGVMSGTSLDHIDVAVAQFPPMKTYGLYSYPIPDSVKCAVMDALTNHSFTMHEMLDLNQAWDDLYAEAILKTQAATEVSICAVGLHGQTIYHRPEQFGTWQLGSIASVSAKCNLPVIGDFRSKDIALGGQGAPLSPLFHQAFFASREVSRGIINLGGIANISCLVPGKEVCGYDIGPANALLDLCAVNYFNQPYDGEGVYARKGRVLPDVLESMLQDSYFSILPPKSTGRDYFSLDWLQSYCDPSRGAFDVMSTIVELVAILLAKASYGLEEIYYCGGGVHNLYLLERIQYHSECKIRLTNELGVNTQSVEALGFAWLAFQYKINKRHDLSSITGSRKAHVLGVHS